MKQIAGIIDQIAPLFDRLLRRDEQNGSWTIYDDELGAEASCCTTSAAASLYALHAQLNDHPGGLTIAAGLAEDVRRRQLHSGAFGQPYYVLHGETGTVDIAEIGASANNLYLVYQTTGSALAKDSLIASAQYLLTQVAEENPGAVYKNPNAKMHDVLNGDIYAAHTFGRAYELTGDSLYLAKAEEIVLHVMNRFSWHSEGWWPYTELWDGSIGMGNSVAYQATIVAFAHPVAPLLSPAVRSQWEQVSLAAVKTIVDALQQGPNDDNEVPWWCRDWNNSSEIMLALAHYPQLPEAKRYVAERLDAIESGLAEHGIDFFKPKVQHDDPNRSPVTTTFRKAATLAAILGHLADRTTERD